MTVRDLLAVYEFSYVGGRLRHAIAHVNKKVFHALALLLDVLEHVLGENSMALT